LSINSARSRQAASPALVESVRFKTRRCLQRSQSIPHASMMRLYSVEVITPDSDYMIKHSGNSGSSPDKAFVFCCSSRSGNCNVTNPLRFKTQNRAEGKTHKLLCFETQRATPISQETSLVRLCVLKRKPWPVTRIHSF
jgi:hypothetical protein